MNITRNHAMRLVRQGKAEIVGLTCDGHNWPEGNKYLIVNRYDLQRTDHAPAIEADEERQSCPT